MRFKGRMSLEQGLRQIDFVPLVNILFLLLIFLMLASSFVSQPAIAVNLPRAVSSDAVGFDNIEILITRENAVYLKGRALSQEDLKNFLKTASKGRQAVMIKADKSASFEKVIEIWDLARSLGISRVNLATN